MTLERTSQRLSQEWVRLCRPPAISSLATVSVVVRVLFFVGGAIGLLAVLAPAASGNRSTAVIVTIDVLAIAASVVLALRVRLMPLWLYHLSIVSGVLLIATATAVAGGGSTSMAYACMFYLVPLYTSFTLPPLHAVLHLGLGMVVGGWVLARVPGVGWSEQWILWANAALISFMIQWLVRAAEAAEIDGLTGLADRRGFTRSLQLVGDGDEPRDALAVALVDLDHFSALNATHGAAAGDQLLVAAARAWSPLVPAGSTLSRFGADSFAVSCTGERSADIADLVEAMRTALPGGGSFSAGIAVREPGESASLLMTRADMALYSARRVGPGHTQRHPGVGTDGRDIRAALARGDLAVHFQPIVELAGGTVVGAEALVRWTHPERGPIAPVDFLPEAERNGVIVELGAWVMHHACQAAAAWPSSVDGAPLRVSVNASGRELQDPRYAGTVRDALTASGLPAHLLTVELVESHYDIESLYVASNLHELRRLGVSTAIDDFGTGYSSLDRLRRLGVDVLKIDRSFVADIVGVDDDAPLVRATLAMSRAMGLRVVAEGVETTAQAQWLRREGCEMGQGYLFGRAAAGAPTRRDVAAAERRQGHPSVH